MAEGLSEADRLSALRQEVRETSAKTISAYLTAAGLGDIPGNGPLILYAVASGNRPAGALARMLGIAEQDASEAIGTLVRQGYLELRPLPGDDTRQMIAITERGRKAEFIAMNGFKAARWAGFTFRPGDIVVSTWPKSGTTWVQTICALLIFQTPDLPIPMSELAPWLDLPRISRDEVFADLAARDHRRIIKTHLALRDLPIDPQVNYIAVGRHPLDTALSLYHQNNNKAAAPDDAVRRRPGPDHGRQTPVSAREWLLGRIDLDSSPGVGYHYLAELLSNLSAAWERRDEPNVTLLHFEDLSADLEGEMRRIAARLGITVPEAIWPDLVQAATFKHMQADPGRFLTAGLNLKDNANFFRKGTSGEGRAQLTGAELARYHAHVQQLAAPDLLAWLHRDDGRGHW